MNIRKVTIPINIKLTSMVLLLTGAALIFYVWLAIDLFKTDKIAYVYESVESQNNQVSLLLEEQLGQTHTYHELFHQVSSQSRVVKNIFKQQPLIAGYAEIVAGRKFKFYSSKLNLNKEDFLDLKKTRYFIKEFDQKKFLVEFLEYGSRTSFILVDLGLLKEIIPKSNLYEYAMVIDDEIIGSKIDLDLNKIKNYGHQTTLVGSNIVSFKPFMEGLVFLTLIGHEKAISAATLLTKRSLYFGILVAGVVILFILLFSHLLTKPINKLYEASLELSKANFSHRVTVKEKDEIGVLGDSFNFMAGEIEKYLAEMKEKARMENELKTAQLVQKSFFPTNQIKGKTIKLNAYYKPSSECGGDWWGHLETPESEIVIIVDVTGHGTAAALMTALMHNTLTGLKHLHERDSEYATDSAKVMRFLNQSFGSVQINLNATAFVGIFHNGKLKYTNASHNPPFWIKANKESYSKQDFTPLNENIGTRLGESLDSSYTQSEIDISKGDKFVLYTDGILEAKNAEDKDYGQRRFIKNMVEQLKSKKISIDDALAAFYSFVGEIEPNDDITLLAIEYSRRKIFLKDIDLDEQINSVLTGMNLELVKSASDADTIVYEGNISDCLKDTAVSPDLSQIISIKDLVDKKDPFEQRILDLQKKTLLQFDTETVSEVAKKIDHGLEQILINDAFSELGRYLKQSALELVQNALIYRRNNDQIGSVELMIARDEMHYVIEVTDYFGKLDPVHILNKAAKAYREKTYEMKEDGAGLGYSMIIIASDEVFIRVKKNEFTKIRSIISKHKRMKDFKQKHNAIYIRKG